jgi:hypothetical protein
MNTNLTTSSLNDRENTDHGTDARLEEAKGETASEISPDRV